MIIKILRIISLIVVVAFILIMLNLDYNKIDCYLHSDNQSLCTPENNYKHK